MADQVALRLVATEVGEHLQLMHALDSLGNDVEAEGRTHGDDGAHERPIVGVVGDAVHEGAVDLDAMQREVLQQ